MSEEKLEYETTFAYLMFRSYDEFVSNGQERGEAMTTETLEVYKKSSILTAVCIAPMMFKLAVLQQKNSDFEPRIVRLSDLAYNRVRDLQKMNLLLEGNTVMDIPFVLDRRIKDEVYCKYE